jgi:hypothetical protein
MVTAVATAAAVVMVVVGSCRKSTRVVVWLRFPAPTAQHMA